MNLLGFAESVIIDISCCVGSEVTLTREYSFSLTSLDRIHRCVVVSVHILHPTVTLQVKLTLFLLE